MRTFETPLERILARAGIQPWPKLFQNLRSSLATELKREHGEHVAASWAGHSIDVAKRHYWQVIEADFAKALSKPADPMVTAAAGPGRNRASGLTVKPPAESCQLVIDGFEAADADAETPRFPESASLCEELSPDSVGVAGLEPATPSV